jgi:hypothetical protein
LERHQEGWQSLGTTRATQPPTVELFDWDQYPIVTIVMKKLA